VKHRREVGDDVVVREAQCAHTERGKPFVALGVGASAQSMDRAIELDGEPAARCEEVEHEARSCVLPSELDAEPASP